MSNGIIGYGISLTQNCYEELGFGIRENRPSNRKEWENPRPLIVELDRSVKDPREWDKEFGKFPDTLTWWGRYSNGMFSTVMSKKMYDILQEYIVIPHFAYPTIFQFEDLRMEYVTFGPDVRTSPYLLMDFSKTMFMYSTPQYPELSQKKIKFKNYDELDKMVQKYLNQGIYGIFKPVDKILFLKEHIDLAAFYGSFFISDALKNRLILPNQQL